MIKASCYFLLMLMFSPVMADEEVTPVMTDYRWPPAPAKARYTFIREIHGEPDSKDEGFWSGLSSMLFGEQQKRHFSRPHDIAISPQGWIAVADPGAQGVHVVQPENDDYHFIQRAGNSTLHSPVGVAFNDLGDLIVTDSMSGMIHVLSIDGDLIRQKKDSALLRPTDVVVHPKSRQIYIVDTAAHCIRVYDENLTQLKSIGKRGAGLGEFNFPTHLTFSADGELYVTDSLNFRIQVFDKYGKASRQFGRAGDRLGEFSKPKGIAIDDENHVYIMDAQYDHMLVYDSQGRFLLPIGGSGSEPGRFSLPNGVAVSGHTIYIVDSYNQRVQVLKKL